MSDIGGPKVIIKHKVNGLKFKNEDMYDFLVQFKTLDESKSTRQKLIKNGFNDYKKNIPENIIINKYLSFLKKFFNNVWNSWNFTYQSQPKFN